MAWDDGVDDQRPPPPLTVLQACNWGSDVKCHWCDQQEPCIPSLLKTSIGFRAARFGHQGCVPIRSEFSGSGHAADLL